MIQYHCFPVVKYFLFLLGDYYLIFKTATLKVKLPVGFPKKQMAQFWVASIPLTPRVTVYCHPIRSSDQIEKIMYSVTLICKSYTFSDFAVMVLVKNSIPGRLLFYREPITLTSLSIVISLQFPHAVRSTDTVLSLEFKDGTALALFKIFATSDILPNAKIFMYLLWSIYNIPVIWESCGNRKDIVCVLSPVLPE